MYRPPLGGKVLTKTNTYTAKEKSKDDEFQPSYRNNIW